MTDEMLQLAERNKQAKGLTNVSFMKGHIENIPLPDQTVDVVISNCVINLCADKGQVLREAFRVLKPGGRFAVSDIVVQGTLPAALRHDMESWTGCISGALVEGEYRGLMADAGFDAIEVEVTRVYDAERLRAKASANCSGAATTAEIDAMEARIVSAFVRGRRPS
jgi:arsenite methyltransferase